MVIFYSYVELPEGSSGKEWESQSGAMFVVSVGHTPLEEVNRLSDCSNQKLSTANCQFTGTVAPFQAEIRSRMVSN